jgi:OOP family OmpA-OmpF porin
MQLKQALVAVATIAAFAGCSNSPSPTRTGDFRNQGYLLDTAGDNQVVKAAGYDVCVRTSDWTPQRAIIECDPDLVPKPVAKAPVAPPPPVAPKAAPTPPPAPPAPPAPPQKFTISADALFAFNSAALRPEGRKNLDEFAGALRGKSYDRISLIGHTDRIGSVSYNQRLSELRAQAVKKYLESKGLDAAKITAVGKGKSQPVTKATDCQGPKMPRAAIVACLQPDRRVEIEVVGGKDITGIAPAAKPEAKVETKPAGKAPPQAKAKPAAKPKPKE